MFGRYSSKPSVTEIIVCLLISIPAAALGGACLRPSRGRIGRAYSCSSILRLHMAREEAR